MKKNNRLLFIFISIIVIVSVSSMVFYVYENLEKEFKTTFDANSVLLQKELSEVNDILEVEGKHANQLINSSLLEEQFKESKYAYLINYFEYDEERDLFHLDNLVNADVELYRFSNITGTGNLDFLNEPDNVKLREIYFLLLENDNFLTLNEIIESSYWVYYTSTNELFNIRNKELDYVTSKEFSYSDTIAEMPFVTGGTFENLPDRNTVFWTHPYFDLVAGSLMVTASYPVDYNGEYLGTISVDFLSSGLNNILDDRYTTFLVDDSGTVISTNIDDFFGEELKEIEDLPTSLSPEQLSNLESGKIHRIDNSQVISYNVKGTPYILYQVYTPKEFLIDALIDIIPIIGLLIVILIINMIYLKSVKSVSEIETVVNDLEEKHTELDLLAKFDELTNVYNRRGLYSELDKLADENVINHSNFIMLDIDHFKKINDTFGHDVGDVVLTELCTVITNTIHSSDILARYGGEEFVIVTKNKSLDETIRIAEDIRVAIEEYQFTIVNNLTISLGVAKLYESINLEKCLKNADTALYEAKRSGRNMVCYFDNSNIKPYSLRK